jgi:hypothetical protein
MMGTWMCGSGIQVWGCKIPLFLPVLERGSQRPDPTFVTRREGRLSLPRFHQEVPRTHTEYSVLPLSRLPKICPVLPYMVHRRDRIKLLPSFSTSVLWLAWLVCPPRLKPPSRR